MEGSENTKMRKLEHKKKKMKKLCHDFTFTNILNPIACMIPNNGNMKRKFKQH